MAEPTTKFGAWRRAQGWTLDDVSGLTGMSQSNLSRIENGLVTPSPASRVQLAHSLGVPVRDIFEPDTEPLADEGGAE